MYQPVHSYGVVLTDKSLRACFIEYTLLVVFFKNNGICLRRISTHKIFYMNYVIPPIHKSFITNKISPLPHPQIQKTIVMRYRRQSVQKRCTKLQYPSVLHWKYYTELSKCDTVENMFQGKGLKGTELGVCGCICCGVTGTIYCWTLFHMQHTGGWKMPLSCLALI